MMQESQTVFVVDDDESLCRMVSRILRSAGLQARTYATAEAFMSGYDATQPGCLLLDVRMPGMSGLELQGLLAAKRIDIPIVFVSGHGEIEMAVACMKAGAVDFLEKPFREQVLLDHVHRALQQDRDQRMHRAKRRVVEARLALLTPRQREIMDLFVAGESTKQIAARLGISPNTVEVHRANILNKMEVESLVDLTRIVCRVRDDRDNPMRAK